MDLNTPPWLNLPHEQKTLITLENTSVAAAWECLTPEQRDELQAQINALLRQPLPLKS